MLSMKIHPPLFLKILKKPQKYIFIKEIGYVINENSSTNSSTVDTYTVFINQKTV